MEFMIFFVKVFFYNLLNIQIIFDYIDEIFIASTNFSDIPSTDLHEISVEVLNDAQHTPSRRSLMKQSPVDQDSPNTHVVPTGPMIIDIKKTVNIRDSGFLDDEDGLSGGDSELVTSRGIQNKHNESVPDEAPTSTDLINRKLKSIKEKFFVLSLFSFVFFRNYQTNTDNQY